MTAIAVANGINQVTSESHKCPILPLEIQRHRRNFKPFANLRFTVIIRTRGFSFFRTIQHYAEHYQNCDSCEERLSILSISHIISFWAKLRESIDSLVFADIMKRLLIFTQCREFWCDQHIRLVNRLVHFTAEHQESNSFEPFVDGRATVPYGS